MKKIILFTVLLCWSMANVFSQTSKDSLVISNASGDVKCYRNSILLAENDYFEIFKNNPSALSEMNLAQTNNKTGKVFTYIGGFVVGFCLGSAISGEKIDGSWGATLGVGAAVAGIGAIIMKSGENHQRNAIGIYNSTFKKSSFNNSPVLELGLSNHGLGFRLRF